MDGSSTQKMKIHIQNHQSLRTLQTQTLNRLLNWFMMQALKLAPERGFHTVTLQLLNDRGMTGINQSVFDRERPTDVISLTYDPIPGEDPMLEGEIFVNVERANQMAGAALPLEQEFALYLAHGCDHLAGSEDDTDEKKKTMLERNQQWVDEAQQNGMLTGLIH